MDFVDEKDFLGGYLLMGKPYLVSNEEVVEIIQSYQDELSLSHCDVVRLCRRPVFLSEVADDISEYLEEKGISEISFGKHDKTMDDIVEIVNHHLDY
jgi:hypothetical protein